MTLHRIRTFFLRKKERKKEVFFGESIVDGLFKIVKDLPTLTIDTDFLKVLSTTIEPIRKRKVDNMVNRWRSRKEKEGFKFEDEGADVLITYYNECKRTLSPVYNVHLKDKNMEASLRCNSLSEFKRKISKIKGGNVYSIEFEFTADDFYLRINMKDSLIFTPSIVAGGKNRKEILNISQKIYDGLTPFYNLNFLFTNFFSFFAIPFAFVIPVLAIIFDHIRGISLGTGVIIALAVNFPVFIFTTYIIRKGFPVVEFKLFERKENISLYRKLLGGIAVFVAFLTIFNFILF